MQKAALISPGTSRRGVEKGAHAARVTLGRRGDDAGSRVRYSRRSRCHRRRWWSSTTRWRHVESSRAWWRTASWSVELVQQRLDGGLIELRRGGLLLLRRRRRGWELHASLWRLGVHWRSLLLVHWRRWWMLVLHLLRLRRRRRRLVLRLLLRRLNRKLNRNFEHLVFVRLFFWRLGGRIRNFFSVFINRRLLSRNDSCDSVQLSRILAASDVEFGIARYIFRYLPRCRRSHLLHLPFSRFGRGVPFRLFFSSFAFQRSFDGCVRIVIHVHAGALIVVLDEPIIRIGNVNLSLFEFVAARPRQRFLLLRFRFSILCVAFALVLKLDFVWIVGIRQVCLEICLLHFLFLFGL